MADDDGNSKNSNSNYSNENDCNPEDVPTGGNFVNDDFSGDGDTNIGYTDMDQETTCFGPSFEKNYRSELQELEPGRVLGDYELIEQVGQGGMGIVWKALDVVSELPVALKFVPLDIQNHEKQLQKMREVFRRVYRLHHPNICPMLALRHDAAYGYFHVMDWLEGVTFLELLKQSERGRLPLTEVVRLLRGAATGLDFAHQKGILHRDVKLTNLFAEPNGDTQEVKLIDFGISQTAPMANARTRVRRMESSGTLGYMALEQCQGEKQDARTDQFALAVVAYEMLAGRKPFPCGNLAKYVTALCTKQPEPIEGLPQYVHAALSKALSRERKDRFASCSEFVQALEPSEPPVVDLSSASSEQSRSTVDCRPVASVPPTAEPIPMASHAGERFVRTVQGVNYAFRWCPAGSFQMGSSWNEPGRYPDEGPQHAVKITEGFWMLETQVTQGMWRSVMGSSLRDQARKMLRDDMEYVTYSGKKTIRDLYGFSRNEAVGSVLAGEGDDLPMYYVSWEDSVAFCRRLEILGLKIQLPTEAQWEYACRAGSASSLYNGEMQILGLSNAPLLGEIGWYAGNSSQGFRGRSRLDSSAWSELQYPGGPCGVHRCGAKMPNAWGLCDMIGNVWEWCWDWFGNYPDATAVDPTGPRSGSFRVSRGGCWSSKARSCRVASRRGFMPRYWDYYLGFRVMAKLEKPDKTDR